MWFAALLLFVSLCLMVVGLVLLIEDDRPRELSAAELSTSAPVVRVGWAQLQARARGCWRARAPRSTRGSPGSGARVCEPHDRSASHRLLAGRISTLRSACGG